MEARERGTSRIGYAFKIVPWLTDYSFSASVAARPWNLGDEVQLVDAPSDILAETSGFTLVEEDDVAFGLGLCREVHRLYNDYQDGHLPGTEAVRAGLMVTVEMLAILSRSVREGMPSMRIMVAAAQTREMLAVVFDYDPMEAYPDPGLREVNRSVLTRSAGDPRRTVQRNGEAAGLAVSGAAQLLAPAGPLPVRDQPPDAAADAAHSDGESVQLAEFPAVAEEPKGSWFRRLTRRWARSEWEEDTANP